MTIDPNKPLLCNITTKQWTVQHTFTAADIEEARRVLAAWTDENNKIEPFQLWIKHGEAQVVIDKKVELL